MSNVQCFFLSLSLFLLVSKRMTRTKMSRNLAVYINLERSGLRYIAFIENVYSRARGGGRYSIKWPTRGDSVRMGYLFMIVGILLVKVYEREEEFLIWVCKKSQKGL